jgi:hypothetical protein
MSLTADQKTQRAEQSRQNGRRSRGGKTPEARRRGRLNALSAGLTAETFPLPFEAEAAARERARWHAWHRPRSAAAVELIDECVRNVIIARRCDRYRVAQLEVQARAARKNWHRRRRRRLAAALELRDRDSRAGLAALRNLAHGCRLLANELRETTKAIQTRGYLLPHELEQALANLGIGLEAGTLAGDEKAWRLHALNLACTPSVTPEVLDTWLEPANRPPGLRAWDRKQIVPADPGACARRLAAILTRRVRKYEARADRLDRKVEEPELQQMFAKAGLLSDAEAAKVGRCHKHAGIALDRAWAALCKTLERDREEMAARCDRRDRDDSAGGSPGPKTMAHREESVLKNEPGIAPETPPQQVEAIEDPASGGCSESAGPSGVSAVSGSDPEAHAGEGTWASPAGALALGSAAPTSPASGDTTGRQGGLVLMLLRRAGAVLLALAAGLLVALIARGADDPARTIANGFESPGTIWEQEQTDAQINLFAHDRSPRAAHEGRVSEHFQFAAGPGSSFFYSYRLPRVPVSNDLRVNLYVRANRAGVRIFGRVVLPADVDPETGQPSFVLVPGTIYANVERWQRIELGAMLPSIEGQARVIRATSRRPVSLEGAYLDRIVVNLYCGVGETDVYLDELAVTPVPPELVTAPAQPAAAEADAAMPKVGATPPAPRNSLRIGLERNRLKRNGLDWFPTAIEAPGADVAELRKCGFDILVESVNADPERLRAAVEAGFLLQINLVGTDGQPLDPEQAVAAAASFPYRDKVAFWGLGDPLGGPDDLEARSAELDRVRAIKSAFRGLPREFSHLTTGVVVDGFSLYSQAPRNLDIIGVRPSCWGSSQTPLDTREYMVERRDLTTRANPNGLFFAWFPASPAPEVQRSVWGEDPPPSWGYPVIQPEQVRNYAFIAIGAGYRGIGFRGNADLTRTDLGKMLLIEMALLNEEIDLFESILAQSKDPIPLYKTYPSDPPLIPAAGSLGVNQRIRAVKEYDPNPFTKVASIDLNDRSGSLLLVSDYFDFGQCQPNQMAMNDLKISVPARESAQGWLISPGGVEALSREKIPGAVRFNVPDYGPTALVLVTTDLSLADRIQSEIERVRPLAVQLAIEQARIQLRWVSEINGRLLADGHQLYDPTDPKAYKLPPNMPPPNDEAALLAKSEELINSAQDAIEREDYKLAWAEARRATRPLRILMFAHWQKAFIAMTRVAAPYPEDRPERRLPVSVRNQMPKQPPKPPRPLIFPITCPPLLSCNLLPQSYIWIDWMRSSFSRNLVPSGTFDEYPSLRDLERAGWVDESRPAFGIETRIETVPSTEDKKKRLLRLSVIMDKDKLDRLPPTTAFPLAAIRSPEVKVKAGQFLRISVDLAKQRYHEEGHGGLIVRDSIGGAPLQFRYSNYVGLLTPLVLFRRVPADGVVTVTLGLAAEGEAFFNNFRVEVAEGPSDIDAAGAGGSAEPRLPDPTTPPRPTTARRTAVSPETADRPAATPRTSR